MNKDDLVTAVAAKTGFTKVDSAKFIDAFVDAVTKGLAKGEEVRLVGFGTFSVYTSKATKAKNPRTGETINVPSSKRAKFKAGKLLKDAVNN